MIVYVSVYILLSKSKLLLLKFYINNHVSVVFRHRSVVRSYERLVMPTRRSLYKVPKQISVNPNTGPPSLPKWFENKMMMSSNQKKSVLITGGAGYIGSHCCVEVQQAGYDVIVVDNCCNAVKGKYQCICHSNQWGILLSIPFADCLCSIHVLPFVEFRRTFNLSLN